MHTNAGRAWQARGKALAPCYKEHPLMDVDTALVQASRELGLQDYYRDMVRPLLGMPRSQWPSCCGGGCEPCAQTLVAVAERVLALLGA